MATIKGPVKCKYLTADEVAAIFSSRNRSLDPCSDVRSTLTGETSTSEFCDSTEDDYSDGDESHEVICQLTIRVVHQLKLEALL